MRRSWYLVGILLHLGEGSRKRATAMVYLVGSPSHYHHRAFARLVGSDGCVTVRREPYYLSTQMSGAEGRPGRGRANRFFRRDGSSAGAQTVAHQAGGAWRDAIRTVYHADALAGPFSRAAPTGIAIPLDASGFVGPDAVKVHETDTGTIVSLTQPDRMDLDLSCRGGSWWSFTSVASEAKQTGKDR